MRDYEQKHREDLEEAKNWLAIAKENNNKFAIQILEKFFPELRESEEEKIRKEIVDFIKENIIITEEQRYMWLDWLEKLGKLNERVWSMEELRELNAVRHLNPGLDSLYLKLKGE